MIVVRVTCHSTDWSEPTDVELDYGEVTRDFSTLQELISEADVSPDECTMFHYTLSGDNALEHDATHMIAIQVGSDEAVGKMFWMDEVIDGPFLLMLAQGEKLKAFTNEECARGFARWLIDRQPLWRSKHHDHLSSKDKVPTRQVH